MGINLSHVCKSYGDKNILNDFNYEFTSESITIISGKSGIGKTTLLNLLLGIEKPDSGIIQQESISRVSAVFQEDRLIENLSAKKNIEVVLDNKNWEEVIKQAFIELGLKGEESTKALKLSGGMKRRIAIIRAILYPSDLIIMDEPFKGLDEKNRRLAIKFIKNNLNKRILIISSHDSRDVEDFNGNLLNL